jgi:hypothetical protein
VTYEIEYDVPMVKTGSGRQRGDVTNALIKLAHSPVGASVMIPGKTPNRISTIMMRYLTDPDGATFKSRTVDGGVRVWRVA